MLKIFQKIKLFEWKNGVAAKKLVLKTENKQVFDFFALNYVYRNLEFFWKQVIFANKSVLKFTSNATFLPEDYKIPVLKKYI